MKYYTKQHKYYCGIDLHARSMYICISDQFGNILVHRNIGTDADFFLQIIKPYREDIVVAVECIFSWYWLADLCAKHNITFVLGHALYMKAIHGGKAKNDKIDSAKINAYNSIISPLEWHIKKTAKSHDSRIYNLLISIPGVGPTLTLVISYEIHDINRFPRVQDFISYSRLVKCAKESGGKRLGTSGSKIGNAHLKWAFSEAAVLFIRCCEERKKYYEKLKRKHGRGKCLSALAAKLGRAVYYMCTPGMGMN